MNHVFIYGAPGVGKLTVAKEFSRISDYKLFHDHILQDSLSLIFEKGCQSWHFLRRNFYLDIVEEFYKNNQNLVSTFCYCFPRDDEFIKELLRKSEKYSVKLFFVRLVCDFEEECRRISGISREGTTKLRTKEELEKDLEKQNLNSPILFVDSFEIDNTKLSPEETAVKIREHYKI